MDMSPYRDLFVSEARGHLSALTELIIRLEDAPADPAIIDEIFRHAHSLKGMAATMGYDSISRLAHCMEDQLSRVRSGEIGLPPALADLLLEGGDALTGMVTEVESGAEHTGDAQLLVARLSSFTPCTAAPAEAKPESTVSEERPANEAAPSYQFRHSDSFKSIRIKTEILDRLVNITGELITNRYRLADCARQCAATTLDEPLHQLSGLLRGLRDEVFRARMLPFSLVTERFPRLVRDLAHAQNKDVTFLVTGREVELDRGILEEISEPIIHLLRNAVDHGMETPDERVAAGKPYQGTISLSMVRDKDHVEIIIADDGRGMDPERLKAKAIEKGFITQQQATGMTPQEAYLLVCCPGFSTAETVSDISGRGVGMDAVRSSVQGLSGTVVIQSQIGQGSRFIVRLPITVSIIQALLVQCGQIEVAVPLNSISRTLELRHSDIVSEAGQNMVAVDGVRIPVRSLNRALGQPLPGSGSALLPALVCDVSGSPAALLADRICGQQEIFVRPLNSPMARLRGVSGATVTGDGRVLFVIDAATLAV